MTLQKRWILLVLALVPALILLSGRLTAARRYDFPLPAINPSREPDIIARGKYLAEGPAACVSCHAAPEVIAQAKKDASGFPEDPPLSGGRTFDTPFGVYAAPNITPHSSTHLGSLSGPQLALTLRYSMDIDQHVVPPFMHYQNMSDDDLTAVLSYLRSRPGVENTVELRQWKLFADQRLRSIKPLGPDGTPPKRLIAEPTVEYGRYLAHAVADCYGCHTDTDLNTGAITGQPFAGGVSMASTSDPKVLYVSPNITPDPKGKMAGWNEDIFLAKFRNPAHPEATSMPWAAFRRMKDDDLRAIYRYLQTVKPVANDPGPVVRARPK